MFSILERTAALALALLLLPAPSSAFWIFTHTPLTVDRLDPIITPGAVGTHVHAIIGSSNFRPTLETEVMQAGNCTTAPVQADMSSYWAPQLYHNNQENNTYTLIPVNFVQTYYLQRDGPTQKDIAAFPDGLRMLAGNPYRSSFNATNMADQAVSFVCLDYSINPTGNQNQFPTTPCKDGLRAQIVFPSCWDGVNVDSADHKSHMAYPIGAPDSGDCPASHPKKLVTLFNEWVFNVGNFDFTSGQSNWVFSFGDNTGLGFHADFVNGWDTSVLAAAVEQCTSDLFGNLEGCPPFAATLDRTKASSCSIASIVDENAAGPVSKLPGCNPIPAKAGAQCPGLVTPAITGYAPAGAPPAAASSTPAAATPSGSATSSAVASTSASASVGATSSAPDAVAPAPSSSSSSTKLCKATAPPSRKRRASDSTDRASVKRRLTAHHRRGVSRLSSHH